MPYIAMVDNSEVELPDLDAVRAALAARRISAETWIADVDVEGDWETVAEKFPALIDPCEG